MEADLAYNWLGWLIVLISLFEEVPELLVGHPLGQRLLVVFFVVGAWVELICTTLLVKRVKMKIIRSLIGEFSQKEQK